jgi:hypothetical protein
MSRKSQTKRTKINPRARVPISDGGTRVTLYFDPHSSCRDTHQWFTLIDDRDDSHRRIETCGEKSEKEVYEIARVYGLRVIMEVDYGETKGQ